ncbi:hypothetical protein [Nitrosopumilus sp.]|uniref:hypothetical protein n=1 Tax=Nitrosopumilus sp. TaxID=2024843 RepID=UPI00292EAB86|nr:hypothetical protein [Nitrosopumilus sp.]
MNNTKVRYVLPAFAAVFALMFAAAATPYVIAEPGQEKQWADESGDGAYDHSAKKDTKQDMAEKLNAYCEMSADEQAAMIAEHNKTEEKVAKMNEYCSLDEAGKQAFIEEHRDEYRKHSEDKMRHEGDYDKKKQHHMKVKVEGFTGAIAVPEMTEETDMKAVHEELKSQITVKFSEAAALAEEAGLDVMKGSIGMAVNENGDKFVAWMLSEINMDNSESETVSTTVFVVDAADTTNTAQVTKEYDHSKMMNKDKGYSHDKQQEQKETRMHEGMSTSSDSKQMTETMADGTNAAASPTTEEIQTAENVSEINTATTTTSRSDLQAQFLDTLSQLQAAITDGDEEKADSLREQLRDIRNQMNDMRRTN